MKLWMRIFIIVFSLSLLTLCVAAGWVLYDTQRQGLERETQRSLDEQQMIMDSMKTSMEAFVSGENDAEAMENSAMRAIRVAARFSTHPGVRLEIADPEGSLLYSSLPDELSREQFPKVVDTKHRGYVLVKGEKPLLLVTGIFGFQTKTYTLLYARDVSQLFEDGRKLALRTAAIVCAAVILLGALLVGFIRRALRPLVRLGGIARVIAAGDYTKRAQTTGEDEVSALAQDFNRMADAVAKQVQVLSRTAQAQQTFIANLAHELKTPMTSIVGYADLMQRVELPHAKAEQALQHISGEGRRLEQLSYKLMDMVSLSHENCIVISERPLLPLLEAAADSVRNRAGERGITIHIDCALEFLSCDDVLLKSLLINLLDNAIKASSQGSEVLLRAAEEEQAPFLEVIDHGYGIPQSEQEHVTEPFYMVDKARSRAQKGAGLGLSLCEAISKAHGAQLYLQSKEGKGTRAKILVPSILQVDYKEIAK